MFRYFQKLIFTRTANVINPLRWHPTTQKNVHGSIGKNRWILVWDYSIECLGFYISRDFDFPNSFTYFDYLSGARYGMLF